MSAKRSKRKREDFDKRSFTLRNGTIISFDVDSFIAQVRMHPDIWSGTVGNPKKTWMRLALELCPKPTRDGRMLEEIVDHLKKIWKDIRGGFKRSGVSYRHAHLLSFLGILPVEPKNEIQPTQLSVEIKSGDDLGSSSPAQECTADPTAGNLMAPAAFSPCAPPVVDAGAVLATGVAPAAAMPALPCSGSSYAAATLAAAVHAGAQFNYMSSYNIMQKFLEIPIDQSATALKMIERVIYLAKIKELANFRLINLHNIFNVVEHFSRQEQINDVEVVFPQGANQTYPPAEQTTEVEAEQIVDTTTLIEAQCSVEEPPSCVIPPLEQQ